jgi:hypothetical protein
MANQPDAWVEDARNLDNAEQLLHSAQGILLETPAIADFLRNETNKRIVVAPKGYGKTFLLKSKRILLQASTDSLSCLPENQLVDATISDSPSLSQADVQRFVDYAFWCQVWSAALMISVVKSSAKFYPLDPADFRSPLIQQLLLSSYPVSPFDALKRLINSNREFQQARRSHDLTTLMSYYRQIRRPMAVFVDTIDEYFEGYVDRGSQYDEDASYLHRNKDSRIWIVGQLGICRAIRELLGVNSHVKIFVSIRKEAFNSLDYYDRNAVNISSLVTQLHYSGSELSCIFDNNIAFMQRDDLAQPRETTPVARFIGASNVMIVNPITKKSEFFSDFVLRHSLYRPRDLMLIGGKIAQIPAGERTQERLRAAVDQAAGEIVWYYLAEMRGLADVPDRLLFGLIPSNVLDMGALKRIAEAYADRLKAQEPDGSNLADPFCALYRLGLLGVVRRNREQKDVQIFRRPHDIEHDASKATLPVERHYLIHPALDDIIAQASSDYIRAFHTNNVIGHGKRWREGRIFKCAAKGDLSRFSRVLNDPVVGERFTRYLGDEFETCKREVEYAALESGDSVVLVDDSADRVLSAARSLQRAVRRFQVPQDFRFGAAVGAIAFSTTTRADGQSGGVRVPSAGIVIRAAARIEPHAAPGTMLCTEEFVSELDETSRSLFAPITPVAAALRGPGLLVGDDGVAVIRKNEQEEPLETRLFQAALS